MFISDISQQFLFFCSFFVWPQMMFGIILFGIRMMVTSQNEFGSVTASAIFQNGFRKICIKSSKCLDFCLLGGFKITDSISVLVIGLFIFSISPQFSFARLYFPRICPFLLFVHFIGVQLLVGVSNSPLYFCGVDYNFSFFISNFIDLVPLPFFLDESG